jgi:hypothetical protein
MPFTYRLNSGWSPIGTSIGTGGKVEVLGGIWAAGGDMYLDGILEVFTGGTLETSGTVAFEATRSATAAVRDGIQLTSFRAGTEMDDRRSGNGTAHRQGATSAAPRCDRVAARRPATARRA